MPSLTVSILTTSFLTLSVATISQPVALSLTPISEPRLIASVSDKVKEFVSEGNSYLAQGASSGVLPGRSNNSYTDNQELLKNNAQAIQSFDKALRLEPQNRDALYGRGLAHLQLYLLRDHISNYQSNPLNLMIPLPSPFGLLDEAISNLGAVTRIDQHSNFVPAYLELGRALLLNKNYQHSIEANLIALELGTKEPTRAYGNIGMAYYNLMLQNPAEPDGPQLFKLAEAAWREAIVKDGNQWFPHYWLGEMHRVADDEFGYDEASQERAEYHSQQAILLYDQTPQGRAERAQEQERQRQQQIQYSLQQRERARQQAWQNRPCSPYPDSLRRHMCQEGYLNPNSVQGANQPMPEDWGL